MCVRKTVVLPKNLRDPFFPKSQNLLEFEKYDCETIPIKM